MKKEELTQETLLTALVAMDRGVQIQYPKTWLGVVMNHKYYDGLRKKYQKPMISFDVMEEELVAAEEVNWMEQQEEAEEIRRALAYLTKIYRDVMIRYYMKGESVSQIASALSISENTIKSRLFAGRKQMKKEISMEKFVKQSYEPDSLWLSCCGGSGLNGEPFSVVGDDRIAMNLLILAYECPVTMDELAGKIGIPCAYVEPIIQRLVDGELMKQTGSKVYTDFIIFTEHDRICNLKEEKQMVLQKYKDVWIIMEEGLQALRNKKFYQKQSDDQSEKLEVYFAVRTMLHAITSIRDEIAGSSLAFKDYPERPNGGKWIAMGK